MAQPTLEDFMSPKALELQARYENARVSINMGWQIASKKYETMQELSVTARWIATEIQKDFDATLEILKEKGVTTSKTEPSQILRPS